MTDKLFLPGTTHVEVECWHCNHRSIIQPGELPEEMTEHDFSRRAVCKRCGTTWPRVLRLPRKRTWRMEDEG